MRAVARERRRAPGRGAAFAALAALAALLPALAGASGCECVQGRAEECWNYLDDDGDGLPDCYDGDCSASLYCICGAVDPSCACPGLVMPPAPPVDAAGPPPPPPPDAGIPLFPPACLEVTCDDREDNDRDQLEDCADPDCYAGCGIELGGWVVESLDGGVPTQEDLFAIWGATPDEFFAVGENGAILRNDGTGWSLEPAATAETLRDVTGTVSSIDGNTVVYAVGYAGTILRYDAPARTAGTWSVEVPIDLATSMPLTGNLHGVWTSADGRTAYAVGDDGLILFRNPGNGVWAADLSPVQDNLFDLWGSGLTDIWAAGSFGVIVHWDGASWCEAVLGSPQIGIPTSGAIRGVWGRGPSEVYFASIGTFILYDGMGPPCPNVGEANGYVELSDLAMPGPPVTQFLDVFGVGSDTFIVGLDGYLVHYDSAGRFFYYVWGDPPARPKYRLDGVWGYDPYQYYDSGVGVDSGVPDLGPPYDLFVVGATGTVLTGP